MKMFKFSAAKVLALSVTGLWLMLLSSCGTRESGSGGAIDKPVYAQGDTITVSGTLVDTRCFAVDRINVGMDHPAPVPANHSGEACAKYCARQGFPVGLAAGEDDSDVWILLSTPPLLSDYMAQIVRIRGVVRSAGILTPIRVEARTSDGRWTFVI